MKRLRTKLGTYQGQPYIETLRGVGYRWNSIKKTHVILLKIYMILYFLAFIEILLYLLQKNMVYLYCEFIILLGLGISGYILKYDNQKNSSI